jgi:enoyl-CoA hydratase/carnithine racemase
VGMITIDNPPKNFNTPELQGKMLAAVDAARQSECRVVMLVSDRPGYFIAHYSLQALVDGFGAPLPPRRTGRPIPGPDLYAELEEGPMISIAVNNGQAWGGGAELSWSCNLRIAGESATYGQPEVTIGIIPGAGGTTRLARLAGATVCMEMIVDGRPITAQRAFELGIVNRVVPDYMLRDAAIEWAAHIAKQPAWALEACKRSLLQGLELPLADARRNESQIFRETAVREDSQELMKMAQARYNAGADSYDAIGIERD